MITGENKVSERFQRALLRERVLFYVILSMSLGLQERVLFCVILSIDIDSVDKSYIKIEVLILDLSKYLNLDILPTNISYIYHLKKYKHTSI